MATRKKGQKHEPPKLMLVPPGGFPSPEEVRAQRRKAAMEAIQNIELGAAQLSQALATFGQAVLLAEKHKLPGLTINPSMDADGRLDPEPWPGTKVLTDEEFDARLSNIYLRMEDMKGLREALLEFLRETKDSGKP